LKILSNPEKKYIVSGEEVNIWEEMGQEETIDRRALSEHAMYDW